MPIGEKWWIGCRFSLTTRHGKLRVRDWAMPECLHVPIAAVDEPAIRNFIGDIEQVLVDGTPPKAFVVKIADLPPIDRRLPIWDMASSKALFSHRQIWVHIAFTRYRNAYKNAFPDEINRRQGSEPRNEPSHRGAEGIFLRADHAHFARMQLEQHLFGKLGS